MAAEPAGTVLLVEDNEDNRAIYSAILRHAGYELVEATTGEKALEEARRRPPDLMLLDISLPSMDGWEVASQLKADPSTRGVLIVALTANALPEDHRKAHEVGCDEFLAKPVRPRQVLETVQELIAGRSGSRHDDGA